MQYISILVYLLFTSLGLILFKLGATSSPILFSLENNTFSFSISVLSIAGICCYLISFLLNLTLISKYSLSYIVPLTTGIVYVIVFITSVVIFKERFLPIHLLGSILIIVGITLINIKK